WVWLASNSLARRGFCPAWLGESDSRPTGAGAASVQSGRREWLRSSLAGRERFSSSPVSSDGGRQCWTGEPSPRDRREPASGQPDQVRWGQLHLQPPPPGTAEQRLQL